MLLAMPLIGFIAGYALGELRRALLATLIAFTVLLAVVAIADGGLLDDGGAFYLAADLVASLGLAWLGVALRERASSKKRSAA